MSDAIYRGSDTSAPEPAPDATISVEDAGNLRSRIDDVRHHGRDPGDDDKSPLRDFREGARALKKQREREGAKSPYEQPPLVAFKNPDDRPRTLNQSVDSIELARGQALARDLLAAGYTHGSDEWNAAVEEALGPGALTQPGLVDEKGRPIEKLGKRDRAEPMSALEAAEALGNWRQQQAEEAKRQEAATEEQQQRTAAENQAAYDAQQDAEARAQADAANQAEREAVLQQQQRQAAEVEIAQLSQHERQLLGEALELEKAIGATGLRDVGQLQALAQRDPAGAQRVVAAIQAYQQRVGRLNEIAAVKNAHAVTAQAQANKQFNEWKSRNDAILESETPELKNPEQAQAMRAAAWEVVRDAGITEQTLQDPTLRRAIYSIEGQRLIRDSARWRMAQVRARAATRAPAPQLVRPGMARSASAGAGDKVDALTNQLGKTKTVQQQLKLAAQLVGARRRAGLL